jgi:hypothetical protein
MFIVKATVTMIKCYDFNVVLGQATEKDNFDKSFELKFHIIK